MPFEPPFATNFTNQDLFYGLSGPRKIFIDRVKSNLLLSTFTIDAYEPNAARLMPERGAPRFQRAFTEFLRNHKRYQYALQENFTPLNQDRAVYRKCKGGLAWATTTDLVPHVHFILDGVNMTHVVEKIPTSTGLDSFTSSELRWIYRNRKNHNVISTIQFWSQSHAVRPPWEHAPSVWKSYEPRSENTPTFTFLSNSDSDSD
jgi:hypothetical protein